ncbi:hypothetical protein HGG63_10210 [Alteromonadaceae bacterium A_SAG1]|nr:hypothetical protein [Alteromonadaceae bacterium A_SAG1]
MSLFKKSKTEQSTSRQAPWKIAIIDDEEGVHEVTKLTLRKFNFGYTDLMVDGAPSPHQSDTTLRWLIDRLRS